MPSLWQVPSQVTEPAAISNWAVCPDGRIHASP